MRLSTLLLSLAAAGAMAAPTLAMAQAGRTTAAPQIDEEVKQALAEVQVRGQPRHYRLEPSEIKQVSGTYAMSNGWTVRVVPRMRHVYMHINDKPPIELFPQSADKFASADGNIATVFNLGMLGDDIVMSYVPDSRLSDQRVIVGSGVLAAR
jgi:hypothetical protein